MQFSLPANILNIIQGSYSDFTFRIAIDGTDQTVLLDHMRFGSNPKLQPVSAVASSSENSQKTASKAIDNNMGTRWSSGFSDPQWIMDSAGDSVCWVDVTMDGFTKAAVRYSNGEGPGDSVNVTFNGATIGNVATPHSNANGTWEGDSDTVVATLAPQVGTGPLCLVGVGPGWIAALNWVELEGIAPPPPVIPCLPACGACGTCSNGMCIPKAAGTVCRGASGSCDAAETCDGTAQACPSDAFLTSGTVCREANGGCDLVEVCSGSSTTCPSDGIASSGTVCRAPAGVCDAAETCNGSAKSCPANAVLPSGTSCRGSVGACDAPETCNGSTTTCPADGYSTAGTVCRTVAGTCDVQEACTGSSDTCPSNAFKANGTVCRTAAGTCDAAETCSGAAAACPVDALKPSGTVCRAAVAGGCDVAETCNGTTNNCPVDAVQPSGTACTDDGNACTIDTCNGTASCPRTLELACIPCGNTPLTRSAAVASSVTGSNFASKAIDASNADLGTRWESIHGHDPEWIYVDLGANVHVTTAVINWENASAKNYTIQIAPNGTCQTGSGCLNSDAPWVTLFTSPTYTATNRTDTVPLSGVGRYLRMRGTARTMNYGYSIEDFLIKGDTNTLCGTQ